jgi:hypothetical protein
MEIDGHTTHPLLVELPAGGVVCPTQAASAQRRRLRRLRRVVFILLFFHTSGAAPVFVL